MAARLRYLLAYDVREPRRLRRVHQVASDYGYPVQYSLFVCDLTGVELVALRRALIAAANLREDSIAIIDLGQPDGRALERVEYLGVRRAVDDASKPAIW